MTAHVLTSTTPGPTRRIAALVALVAPVVAVAVSVTIAVWQLDDVAVLAASIVVVTMSGWYALTRRGVVRVIAAGVAIIAATGVITVGLRLLVVQIALLLVFALAGRYALGPDAGTLFESGCRARAVGAARSGVLIVNPRSGNGRATALDLPAESRSRGIRPVTLEPGDDLSRLAEQAVADGADVLGMAGGDGSQAVVASVAVRHGVAYVCVPAGTRNHFALDLGLDRGDLLGALDAFTDGVERTVDLGRVNDRVFVNNVSLGVYAQVVQSSAYRGAKARTWGRLLPDLLGPAAAPSDLEFDGPDDHRYSGLPLVLVSNNPYRLSRVARHGGRPKLDTGRLGILAARVRGAPPRRVDRLRRIADLMAWSRTDFEVRSTAAVPVGLDGEALVLAPPLRFASMPGVLRVRLPRQTRGAQRARRNVALNRRDLTTLVRIASGRPILPAVSDAATT
jgi:diacylglycerol kinase family enzyme